LLESVNLKKSLSKAAYRKALPDLQERLRRLQYAAKTMNVTTIVCLEGWDAAGKGMVARKLTEKLDPRLFSVCPSAPPTPLEQRYHFLHRHQLSLPNYGSMAIYDRGWYRRLLEERCDKLVKKSEWREAYQQINEFERWLTDDGQVLAKFWLHISKKKQRQRFKKYLADPNLAWRVTKAYRRHHRDYKKWISAVEEMLAKTETAFCAVDHYRSQRSELGDCPHLRGYRAADRTGARPAKPAQRAAAASRQDGSPVRKQAGQTCCTRERPASRYRGGACLKSLT
jgi:polyphosphate kinase 2 (PPK2 family)